MIPEILATLDALPEFLVILDADGRIVAPSRRFARAVDGSRDSLIGRSVFDLLETPPERAREYFRQCARTRQPTPGALVFRTSNGERLDCQCSGAALRPEGQFGPGTILLGIKPKTDVVTGFAALNQKIADLSREVRGRRRAESQLRDLNEALAQSLEARAEEIRDLFPRLYESERQFRYLVDSVTDYAIFMLDQSGRVATWNAGAERIKGYMAEEVVGQHFSIFYTEEDRRNGVPDQALATARRAGRIAMDGWRVRKGGDRFWASIIINPVLDEAGRTVGFAKVTRDLTERRSMEEQLRQVQKMEAIGQLTGGIAHDFNNLLTVISGNIETVQRRINRTDPGLYRHLDAAFRAVERASTLTHRLLAYSRRQPLEPKPVELNRLIIGMSDLLGRTIGAHITIETVLAGGLWQVSADPNQIENAILNLAVNARDAMPEGGKLTIETANTHLDEQYARANAEVTPGQYVMLAVTDTGTGMTPDVVEKAFEPFFTTKEIGEGTGLGLSQVYGFIKQSGGHIKIYSEPGQGTTVRLYLTRIREGLAVVQEDVPAAQPLPLGGREAILVVEDNDEVRAYTTDVLRELGYEVFEATEGDTALSLVASEPRIKLLFTDVGLPGPFNGRQIADEARKLRSDLKVLFTTGYAQNAIIHQGRLDPGVQLIVKPFNFASLAAKIRQMFDGAE
jgi:PAS domain S-box-containing protein